MSPRYPAALDTEAMAIACSPSTGAALAWPMASPRLVATHPLLYSFVAPNPSIRNRPVKNSGFAVKGEQRCLPMVTVRRESGLVASVTRLEHWKDHQRGEGAESAQPLRARVRPDTWIMLSAVA